MQNRKGTCSKEGAPDLVFAALTHLARRDMVRRTLKGDHAIPGLARRYDMSFAAVRKHVAILEEAGLVTKTRRGREQRVRADPETLAAARETIEALEGLWVERLDRFEQAL